MREIITSNDELSKRIEKHFSLVSNILLDFLRDNIPNFNVGQASSLEDLIEKTVPYIEDKKALENLLRYFKEIIGDIKIKNKDIEINLDLFYYLLSLSLKMKKALEESQSKGRPTFFDSFEENIQELLEHISSSYSSESIVFSKISKRTLALDYYFKNVLGELIKDTFGVHDKVLKAMNDIIRAAFLYKVFEKFLLEKAKNKLKSSGVLYAKVTELIENIINKDTRKYLSKIKKYFDNPIILSEITNVWKNFKFKSLREIYDKVAGIAFQIMILEISSFIEKYIVFLKKFDEWYKLMRKYQSILENVSSNLSNATSSSGDNITLSISIPKGFSVDEIMALLSPYVEIKTYNISSLNGGKVLTIGVGKYNPMIQNFVTSFGDYIENVLSVIKNLISRGSAEVPFEIRLVLRYSPNRIALGEYLKRILDAYRVNLSNETAEVLFK